ncbi:MAG: GNAT family N-acetyltransferase [Candidatus Cloacimonetes bacterium]|nr:GNAT family N-acetyltransferase [Candidatus Cloacimonadota bacterium]
MSEIRIVRVDSKNLKEHPQVICYINPKHPSYHLKTGWLTERFREGLIVKLVYPADSKKAIGYIEYIPGKYNWRGVTAPEQMFIHCIWVNSTKHRNQGIATRLLEECLKDTKEAGLKGIAVLTSNDAFMAKSSLFLKNGFRIVDTAKPDLELLLLQETDVSLPVINDFEESLKHYQGLNLLYSMQCPWVARFVSEIEFITSELGVDMKIHRFDSAEEAQKAPSPYGVFNLINNGKLLADHYISETRFKNILKKEKLI